MRFFTSIGCSSTSKPATEAVPDVGGKKHVSMRIVVVLPAPFGPRKPTIWPFSTSNEMVSTAVVRAYLFVSSLTLIIVFSIWRKCPHSKQLRTAECFTECVAVKQYPKNFRTHVSTLLSHLPYFM